MSNLSSEEIGILKRLASVFPSVSEDVRHSCGKLAAKTGWNSSDDWWQASSEDPSAIRKAKSRDGQASIRVDHQSSWHGREWVCSVMTPVDYSSRGRPTVFVSEDVNVVRISKGQKHW